MEIIEPITHTRATLANWKKKRIESEIYQYKDSKSYTKKYIDSNILIAIYANMYVYI